MPEARIHVHVTGRSEKVALVRSVRLMPVRNGFTGLGIVDPPIENEGVSALRLLRKSLQMSFAPADENAVPNDQNGIIR